MPPIDRSSHSAPAHVVAMLVAADGRITANELGTLERLDAFRRLGIGRDDFIDLAQGCIDEVGHGLHEQSWLRSADLFYVNGLFDAVECETLRLLVCRLGAAALTADGCVRRDERMVYEHLLARWRIHSQQVAAAIRQDAFH